MKEIWYVGEDTIQPVPASVVRITDFQNTIIESDYFLGQRSIHPDGMSRYCADNFSDALKLTEDRVEKQIAFWQARKEKIQQMRLLGDETTERTQQIFGKLEPVKNPKKVRIFEKALVIASALEYAEQSEIGG